MSNLYLRVEAAPGMGVIPKTFKGCCELADRLKISVICKINGTDLFFHPGDNFEKMLEAYGYGHLIEPVPDYIRESMKPAVEAIKNFAKAVESLRNGLGKS